MTQRGKRPIVIVVGSANIDLNFVLPRLPRPGETVTGGQLTRLVGGKGANQASAAARLGANTFFIGRVGDDDDGVLVRTELTNFGVDTSHLLTTFSAPTGVAAVMVGADAENLIGVASGANACLTATDVVDAIDAIDADIAVVLACLEVPLDVVHAAARAASSRGYPFVLNPAPASALDADLLSLVSVLTPNEHELPFLGYPTPEAILRGGAQAVAVTRGPAGVDLYAGRQREHVPAFHVDVVDSTGAGDAFNGALAWGLASDHPLPASVRFASAAGALATRNTGARASLPTYGETVALGASPAHRDPTMRGSRGT